MSTIIQLCDLESCINVYIINFTSQLQNLYTLQLTSLPSPPLQKKSVARNNHQNPQGKPSKNHQILISPHFCWEPSAENLLQTVAAPQLGMLSGLNVKVMQVGPLYNGFF